MNTPAITTITPTAQASSVHTSLAQLFELTQVQAIEIPLIQRDYAQGRKNPQVDQIRERFITCLCEALKNPDGIDLDFVFGNVVNLTHGNVEKRTLCPLDGQQRLTTLFLLHCYLAWHLPETKNAIMPWRNFSYATRPGAREFCKFLGHCRPDMATRGTISAWLQDQPNYLATWKHDPTIQGMLVVLDALQQQYEKTSFDELQAAWQRLTDPENPAIRFHLLPIQSESLDNSLYVKMNSRGRPLTAFENFKAELERLMKHEAIPEQVLKDFSRMIDTDWSDLFWKYRSDDHQIDEKFMRYLRFLFEVLAWTKKKNVDHESQNDAYVLAKLAEVLLGSNGHNARENLNWITQALNVWIEKDANGRCSPRNIKLFFDELLIRTQNSATTLLRIFNFQNFNEQKIGVDMFRACCDLYGTPSWNLAHTLLFYGVVVGLIAQVSHEEFRLRLRLLRNLIAASVYEIRAASPNNMPELLREVKGIMENQPLVTVLDTLKTFNQVQVLHEKDKSAFLSMHPSLQDTLHGLEDHDLLRGGLTVFEFDPAQNIGIFKQRAKQLSILFMQPYSQVAGALLTKGLYGRDIQRRDGYRLVYLGAPKKEKTEPWLNLLRARSGENPRPTSKYLMALLDNMSAGQSLQTIMNLFLNDPTTLKDWRYYIVKYGVMRSGESGCYVISANAGYSICMLKGEICDDRNRSQTP